MKKSLTVNYLYNVVYKILTLITPLITTPYVSRVLGVENIGIYNYTYAILSYFVLFGVLGLQMYGQREVAYRYNDKQEKNKIFWGIFWTRILSVGIVLLVYIVFSINSSYKEIYLLFSLELIANAIDISWLYYGNEDLKTITIRNIIVKIIGILCIFLFVRSQEDLKIYVLCHTGVLLLGNISLWVGIKREISGFYGISKKCMSHLKKAIIFFLPQCLDSIYMLMDKVMLGNMGDMTQVGIYGQADKIIKMVVTVITSLGLVISPRIAQCFVNKDADGIKKYMKQSFSFVFVLSLPMILGFIVISDSFSVCFFGEGYSGVEDMIKILAPAILFMGLNSIMGWQYLMTVGREKDFTKSVAVGAFANFILNAILIPKMNAKGAAIASIISMIIMSAINFHYIKDVLKLREIITKIVKPLFSSCLMLIILLIISPYMEISLFSTILQVCIGAIIYFGLLLIMKEKMVLSYFFKLKSKLVRK